MRSRNMSLSLNLNKFSEKHPRFKLYVLHKKTAFHLSSSFQNKKRYERLSVGICRQAVRGDQRWEVLNA